jgi:hypothetical protein
VNWVSELDWIGLDWKGGHAIMLAICRAEGSVSVCLFFLKLDERVGREIKTPRLPGN